MVTLYSPEDYYTFINLLNCIVSQCKDNVFTRYQTSTSCTFSSLTYEEFDRITTNLACQWQLSFLKDTPPDTPVALLADHSVDYVISVIAIMKLKRVVLAIAPRNSHAAIRHLVVNAGAKSLITSKKYEEKAQVSMKEDRSMVRCHSFGVFDIPAMAQEPLHADVDSLIDKHFDPEDKEKTAIIIHSSGSTSFPKLIHLSNRYVITLAQHDSYERALADNPDLLQYTVEPSDVFLVGFPMFHIGGLYQMFSPIMAQASTLLFSQLPVQPRDIITAIDTYNVTISGQLPIILEQLYEYLHEAGNTKPLEKLKMLHYGGAPLNKEVGDFFQSFCKLQCRYGSTEMGITFRSSDLHGWSTLQPVRIIRDYCYMEPFDGDLYHLVIKAGCPTLANDLITRPNGDYATNDLMIEDPPGSNCWRTMGRCDDTLVMRNGEKTNPVPMEIALRRSPLIHRCTIIAQDRPCTAVLIELSSEEAKKYNANNYYNQVQAAVDEANKDAPKHSTILPQMIYILPLGEELPVTEKGTVMRGRAIEQFGSIIDAMYNNFLSGHTAAASVSSQEKSAAAVTADWSLQDIENLLIRVSCDILQKDTSIFDDGNSKCRSLFDYGLDSILAIQLRNRIGQLSDITLPANFLYEYPTITSMAKALVAILTPGGNKISKDSYQVTQDLLKYYLERADKDFEPVVHSSDMEMMHHKNGKEIVLLTGATGTLGVYMLKDLLLSPQVSKVYCPVRGPGGTFTDDLDVLMARIKQAFIDRHLDTTLLDEGGSKIQVLPMDMDNIHHLGWGKDTYDRLRNEVTIVQACAWLVDFNQPVTHFDKSCIQGLYSLLHFAYRRTDPIHVHMVSSVSATAGIEAPSNVPESVLMPANPKTALPNGYAQSKYIVEHLFEFLWRDKGWPCMIERMGQVCGDKQHAIWNPSEMYPLMMIGGGASLGKMPEFPNRTIDWLPVDDAATAIVDIMLKTSPFQKHQQHVFHIVNPSTMTWTEFLNNMRTCGVQFDIVSPEEWVRLLSKDQGNPAYRLLSFMEAAMKSSSPMSNIQTRETKNTVNMTSALNEASTFNVDFMRKHLDYWKSIGFYKP